jgi:hypothetical protein
MMSASTPRAAAIISSTMVVFACKKSFRQAGGAAGTRSM